MVAGVPGALAVLHVEEGFKTEIVTILRLLVAELTVQDLLVKLVILRPVLRRHLLQYQLVVQIIVAGPDVLAKDRYVTA
jgi:hypothetical protein